MPASDSHTPPDARVRERDISWGANCDRCDVRMDAGRASIAVAASRGRELLCGACRDEERLLGERDEARAENARLRKALKTAADDLDKAANQFEGIRQAQKAGHEVQVVSNSRVFAAKALRARKALEAGER
jgi:hypothetical protein